MKTFGKIILIILLILIVLLGIGAGIGIWYVNDKLSLIKNLWISKNLYFCFIFYKKRIGKGNKKRLYNTCNY